MGILQERETARRWFDLLAPGYDAVVPSLFWPDAVQRAAIERLDLESAERVLDVGCGTGETTKHLESDVASVHGLDLSAPQLRTAAGKADLEDATFVRSDVRQLPYADETFDAAVSVGSIPYWDDPLEALRELRRVTKPGGEVLVVGFNRRPFSPWNPARNAQEWLNAMYFFRYGPEEGTRLFREAGWTDVEHEGTGPVWSPDLAIATTARAPE